MVAMRLAARVLLSGALVSLSLGCGAGKEQKPLTDLVRELKDSDEAIRIKAARNLGEAGSAESKEATKALSEALRDKSAHVRQAAARSLGAIGSGASESSSALKKALEDSDQGVRLEAEKALKNVQRK